MIKHCKRLLKRLPHRQTNSAWTLGLPLLCLLLGGCDLFKFKEQTPEADTQKVAVARVQDKFLYKEDLAGIAAGNMSQADSINRVELYVKAWIRKQLLISEAEQKIEFNEADIERKMLDYRYALMVYEYEKFYINNQLDKSVTEDEIAAYYASHQDNFELKQNIIKGIFVKLSKDAPRLNRFRRWMRRNDQNSLDELRSYCYQFATNYSLEDSSWVNFEDVIQNTPFASIPNKVQFLRNNKYNETADDEYYYFLKIVEYKISDEISPLEFVRDDIENIIINKRKIALANQLEEDVYNRAKNENEFEIFNP